MEEVICPGCGWIGTIEGLTEIEGACPDCRYENGLPPYRLLTLQEMLDDKHANEYNDVRMDLFLGSVLNVFGIEWQ